MNASPPPVLFAAWIALLGFLSLTIFAAYLPLGAFNIIVALTIAAAKVLIIAFVFMDLKNSRGLMVIFAAAGFFWLSILFWLSFTDYLTRSAASAAS